MKKIAGLVLVGLLGFFGSANAAIITILEDDLAIITATHSLYGEDDSDYYHGRSFNQNIRTESVTEVYHAEDPHVEGSYSAGVRYVTELSYVYDEYNMSFFYETDFPWLGVITGYDFVETNLRLIFNVKGDDGSIRFSGTGEEYFRDRFTSFTLLDLTSKELISVTGPDLYVDLIDTHTYVMTYYHIIRTAGDIYPLHGITIRGAVVPEPSSLILLGAGLVGLGFTRKFKKV